MTLYFKTESKVIDVGEQQDEHKNAFGIDSIILNDKVQWTKIDQVPEAVRNLRKAKAIKNGTDEFETINYDEMFVFLNENRLYLIPPDDNAALKSDDVNLMTFGFVAIFGEHIDNIKTLTKISTAFNAVEFALQHSLSKAMSKGSVMCLLQAEKIEEIGETELANGEVVPTCVKWSIPDNVEKECYKERDRIAKKLVKHRTEALKIVKEIQSDAFDSDAPTPFFSYLLDNGIQDESIETINNCKHLVKKVISLSKKFNKLSTDKKNITTVAPNAWYFANHKVVSSVGQVPHITSGEEEKDVAITVGRYGTEPIKIHCFLSYEAPGITTTKPLTEYDKNVVDAIATLQVFGNEYVTASMIYRHMTHDTENKYVTPQQRGAITRSINKLKFMRIRIDATEEMKKRGLIDKSDTNKKILEGYVLPVEEADDVTLQGTTVNKCYRVIKTPILYEYSSMFNQVINVNPDLLDIYEVNKKGMLTKSKIANTEKRIAVKSYLIREIGWLRTGTRNKRIKLSTLYERVLEKQTEDTKRDTREYVAVCLKNWKSCGWIKNFHEVKKGRAIESYEIET